MIERSTFIQNIDANLLNITFKSAIGCFNFRIRENQFFATQIDGPVTDFIAKSGIQKVIVDQLQDLPAQAVHYRDYSLGFSATNQRNSLSVGIRAKLYLGKSSLYSELSGKIHKESENYQLKSDGMVYLSVPETTIFETDGSISGFSILTGSKTLSYLTNIGNPGFGVDLGLNYRITPDLSFSVSILDLGKINWKTNLNSKYLNGSYTFSAKNINSSLDAEGNEFIVKNQASINYLDSISDLYKISYQRAEFSRELPFTIFSGLKYMVNPQWSIGLVNRYVHSKDFSYNSISASARYEFNPEFSMSSGISVIGNSFFNIPLAFLVNKKFGQVYFGTDNCFAFLIPSISEYASFSFGTCFYLSPKRNLYQAQKEGFPFFRPKKQKVKKGSGLILKEYPEF